MDRFYLLLYGPFIWALIFLVAFILAMITYINCIKYTLKFEEDFILLEIQNNLDERLIYSIIPREKHCEENEEELVFGQWEGIKEGCILEGQIKTECSEAYDFEKIKSINYINYTYYRKKKICLIKKNKYIDELRSNKIIQKNKSCPNNYKLCGIIDTLEQKYCVPVDEICPINFLKIDNDSFPLENFNFTIKNYSIGNGYFIFYSNENNNGKILSIFKLNQNGFENINIFPCINTSEKNWNYYYPLEQKSQKCITDFKGQKTDLRYEVIDNIIKYDLYKDNGIPLHLYNYDINILKEENITLYGRNFLGLDINKFGLLNYSYNDLNNTNNLLNLCLKIITLDIVIGLLIIFVICIFLIIIKKYNKQFEFRHKKQSLILIIGFIMFLIIIIVSHINFYCIVKNKNGLNINISDEIANYFINIMKDMISELFPISLSFIIINALSTIFLIILIIFGIKNDYNVKKKRNDENLLTNIIN